MTEQEELIQYGEDCELVLKSESFNRVVNSLFEQSFQKFVNSQPEQKIERETAYNHYRALVDVGNTLKQQVAVKEEIIAKSEGDTSQEEQQEYVRRPRQCTSTNGIRQYD